ncbi:MAG: DUF433 domain-containing protein [Bacteroidota bacterium]
MSEIFKVYRKGEFPPREQRKFNLIRINPAVRFGKACIGATRFTLGDLLGYLAAGMSFEEILDDFPYLTREGIIEALEYVQGKENRAEIILAQSE